MKNLLVVVDYQNDFVVGSLGFEKAVDIEENICNKIKEYRQNNDSVIFTIDTHEKNYLETQEGEKLPVEHCIKNTNGIKIYGKVAELATETDLKFEKNTFGSKELAHHLEQNQYTSIEFAGVVSNICVISNAVIAKAFQPEAIIIIDTACIASNDENLNQMAINIMKNLQMEII